MKQLATFFFLLGGMALHAQITLPNTIICENDTCVGFSDQTPGAIAWYWDFGDPASGPNNNSTLQNTSHCYPHGVTSYTVTCTVTTSSGTQVNTATFQFVANPVASFSATNIGGTTMQFTDLSTGGVVWRSWDYGDLQNGATAAATITHTYAATGSYNVILVVTDSNGCNGWTVDPVLVSTSGVAENGAFAASVYPNPVASEMVIELPGATGATIMEFFDAAGKLALAGTYTGERFRIDVSALPPGNYLLRLVNDERESRQQISITR